MFAIGSIYSHIESPSAPPKLGRDAKKNWSRSKWSHVLYVDVCMYIYAGLCLYVCPYFMCINGICMWCSYLKIRTYVYMHNIHNIHACVTFLLLTASKQPGFHFPMCTVNRRGFPKCVPFVRKEERKTRWLRALRVPAPPFDFHRLGKVELWGFHWNFSHGNPEGDSVCDCGRRLNVSFTCL